MKTVYIVRHAKSSWEQPELKDELRPLLEKGKKRTKKVIDYFLANDIHVDYIISSHAVRALETARFFAHAIGNGGQNVKVEPNLYFASSQGIYDQFFDLPEKYESVMIVGHNPTLTDFVNRYLNPRTDNLPTSGVVSISFDTDRWEEVPVASFKVNFYIYPKLMHKGM